VKKRDVGPVQPGSSAEKTAKKKAKRKRNG
jgi:hypothetical protein